MDLDPTTTVIVGPFGMLAGMLAGMMYAQYHDRAMSARRAASQRMLQFARGMVFNFDGAPKARTKPHRLPDEDKQLLAIKDAAQLAAEKRMHARKDSVPLTYWNAGVNVEWHAELESVARFIAMPTISRRKHWTGGTETYSQLLASFVHLGKVIQVSEKPPRYVWSRAWSTCRRRAEWWTAAGYDLPPPRAWNDGQAEVVR